MEHLAAQRHRHRQSCRRWRRIIGLLLVLVVVVGSVVLIRRYDLPRGTPAAAHRAAQRITDYRLPRGYHGEAGMIMHAEVARFGTEGWALGPEIHLVQWPGASLADLLGPVVPDPADFLAQFKRQRKTCRVVRVRGQEVAVQAATVEDTIADIKRPITRAFVLFEGKRGTALAFAQAPAEDWHPEAFIEFLESTNAQ